MGGRSGGTDEGGRGGSPGGEEDVVGVLPDEVGGVGRREAVMEGGPGGAGVVLGGIGVDVRI